MHFVFAIGLSVLLVAPAVSAQEHVATISGIANVKDGDGVLFGQIEIRLQGIAAPEIGDAMGRESYLGLVRLADKKHVVCNLDGTTAGKYKRPVGVCFVNGEDIGRAQIAAGLARDCPAFSKGRYREVELQARASGHDLSKLYNLPKYC